MKTALLFFACLHGLIHLMGFLKAFKLAEIQQLTQPISTTQGVFWLIGALLFLAFALAAFLEKPLAGYLGLAAVVLSQVLIFTVWQDAKFGSIANLILLFVAIQMIYQANWEKKITSEKAVFKESGSIPDLRKTEELPLAIQKWLKASGYRMESPMISAEIHQTAQMKMKPAQKDWKEAQAFQVSSLDPLGFHWQVEMDMIPGFKIFGRDQFKDGIGEMLIRIGAAIPIVDESGDKINEGSLQRFLGELVWMPSLALHPGISWKELDKYTAEATLKINQTSGSGTFHFNDGGDFVRFEALRFYENKEDSKRFPWILKVEEYRDFEGIRIPSTMNATWKLPERDWTWLRLQIDSIRYTYN
ncbi:DUF6544 family protein [Algoriphagus marincola]|uniref:DUF6544 family protein n=1 Tax=Algoriphagus marincola TaxID=264027 RepID=UPI00047A4297|nr:DUF6544 family protein [Algoriphagus marincola]